MRRRQDESSWPTFVLVKKGTKRAILYTGEKKAEAIAGYLKKETGATIGSFVYSLGLFDGMAARFVKIENDDKSARLEKKLIAYTCKYLSYVMTVRADPDTKAVVGMYVKFFMKSIVDGDYANRQLARFQKLTTSDNAMSVKKKEENNQRLHILSKFTDPLELTPEQR